MSQTATNLTEYSVSELSGLVRRLVETNFDHVRVRGELGRVTIAGSGHVYLDLKDDKSVISGVMWKGTASRLAVRPEQGLEVIVTGKMTTFPGQSKYQLVIEAMEPAGAGALMALFEERKKKLAAEGLFAPERKRPLPFLPKVIGVVTSPTGAVIRDILHRLRDRFPVHVVVWPSLVQGDKAAEQIIAGINGFNALPDGGTVAKPDLLIVARGGGSLEDLWCFNDENVARAAAASAIPLISAVGHETDTTLIDFVADRRAPTPTAAAEIAVPVRSELLAELGNKAQRLVTVSGRQFETARLSLTSAMRGLGRADQILDIPTQRLDRAEQDLRRGLTRLFERRSDRLSSIRLSADIIRRDMLRANETLSSLAERSRVSMKRLSDNTAKRLGNLAALLKSYSYQGVLDRGYALVLDSDGHVIRSAKTAKEGSSAKVRFNDGERAISFGTDGSKPKKKQPPVKPKQTSLF